MAKLTYLLILLLLPLSLGATDCSTYREDDPLKTQCKSCTGASKEWVSKLNRCMTTKQASSMRKDAQACAQLTDKTKQNQCLANFEKKYVQLKPVKKKNLTSTSLTTYTAGASAAYILYKSLLSKGSKGLVNPACVATKLYGGASAVNFATNIFMTKKAKKELSNRKDKAKKLDELDSAYEKQLQSFIMLRDEQKDINKWANKRTNAYNTVAAGYVLAGAYATYELIQAKLALSTPPCDIKSSAKNIALSAVSAGFAKKLGSKSKGTASDSKSNIEKLDRLIATFRESIAGFCPDGREDINNPRCYCYTANKRKNTHRSKSDICKNLWASDDQNFFIAKTNYNSEKIPVKALGCVDSNQKPDYNCACKRRNNCLKIDIDSELLATQIPELKKSEVSKILSDINKFSSGANQALGSLSSQSLGKNAIKVQSALDSYLNKLKKKKPSLYASINKEIDKYKNGPELKKYTKALEGSLGSGNTVDGKPLLSLDQEQIGKIDQAGKGDGSKTQAGNLGFSQAKGTSNLNITSKANSHYDPIASGDTELKSLTFEDLIALGKAGNSRDLSHKNQISQSDNSIWEIITKRYHQTISKDNL